MSSEGARLFYEYTERDPLFAAEGIDIARARSALANLGATIRRLEGELAKRSFARRLFLARYPIAQHSVPLAFLSACVDCEEARRLYMSEPTLESARHLALQWQRAASVLGACLRRYRDMHSLLRRLYRVSGDYSFEDRFGNTSSSRYVDAFLDSLEANARMLREHADHRAAVLSGEEGSDVSLTPDPRPLTVERGDVSPTHARIHGLELLHSLPFRHVEIIETHGPFRYVMPHFDGMPTPHLFNMYVYRHRKNKREGIHVSLLDRYYFYELDEKNDYRFNDIGLVNYHSLTSRGISHWYEQAVHLYTMRDQRYWMDIATMADLARRPDLNARRVNKQRSSMLDYMFDVLVCHAEFNISYALRREHNGAQHAYSPYRGLITHTYPSIYYLTFNKSVWRLPADPACLGDGRASGAARAYLPDYEVVPDLPPGMIEKIMQGSRLRESDEIAGGYSVYQ